MIPVIEEPQEMFENFKCYENCFFCGKITKHWHWRTNQPVCVDCSKRHKVAELPKSHPKYKPPTKEQYQKGVYVER